MPKISIHRRKESINSLANYLVYIDGEKIGGIANGETKEFDTIAGQHTICIKIWWVSSPTLSFDINDNETKIFKVGGFKYGNWLMPLTLGIIVLHLILNNAIGFKYLILLVIPTAVIIFYYLTIGHNKYLTLKDYSNNWSEL